MEVELEDDVVDDDDEELEDEVEVEVEVELDVDVVDEEEVVDEDEAEDEVLEVVAVEGVDDVVWLVDDVSDWLVEVFPELELKTRYPPTAATITTTTTTAAMAVLTALRPLRGPKEVLRDNLPSNFSDIPASRMFI